MRECRLAQGLAPITDARVNVIEADCRAFTKANGANATGAGSKHAAELLKGALHAFVFPGPR